MENRKTWQKVGRKVTNQWKKLQASVEKTPTCKESKNLVKKVTQIDKLVNNRHKVVKKYEKKLQKVIS